jgi:hypothetical protein
MINFIHIFGLTVFTLLFKYLFLKDFYFYFDDFSVFADFEQTGSIVPVFTDRPLAGLFLISIFNLFGWNALYYHIFGAILEITANLTVYYVFDRIIWHNKFYSSLTVLVFLLMPGHSQQHWWIILSLLKFLLIIWLLSVYLFHQFLLTNKNKFLWSSAFLYGTALFCYELAFFLPIVYLILYFKLEILTGNKKNWSAIVKILIYFGAYIGLFLIYRLTNSFGLPSTFSRTQILTDDTFLRYKQILESTFWSYPKMDYAFGMKEFTESNFVIFRLIIISSIFLFLLISWSYSIFKLSNNINVSNNTFSYSKNDYLFIFILGVAFCIYPLIPFFITPAWFDTRHTYLPHLGVSILLVLVVRILLDNLEKSKINKKVQYCLSLLILFCISNMLSFGASSMIGLGMIWREVGLDFKNHEISIQQNFPAVKPNTLLLIKNAETIRQGVPVFAGSWVVDGFFRKIYPHQGVQGKYYNIPNKVSHIKLIGKIDPTFNYMVFNNNHYPFEQIIILDGTNKLQPFSSVNIKTRESNYLKKLQAIDNDATMYPVLELLIP